MARFSRFLAIDWSGAKGERHRGIALALAEEGSAPPALLTAPPRGWSREEVLALLLRGLPPDTLVGMDLGMALPFVDAGAFFPGWAPSPPDARALWALTERLCAHDPHLEAGGVLRHPELARYFRQHGGRTGDRFHLPGAATLEGRFRVTEHAQRQAGVRPVSNFNLVGAAQVGKSTLTGMRLLHRLGGRLPVWPFDPLPASGAVAVEIYTSIAALAGSGRGRGTKLRSYEALNRALAALGSRPVGGEGPLDDHSSDALASAAWLRSVAHRQEYWTPAALTPGIARTEGWTFGAL